MFGIGGFELFLILLFAFLIFGPDKLPEIAKTIGKGIVKFRGAQAEMTEQLKSVSSSIKESAVSSAANSQDDCSTQHAPTSQTKPKADVDQGVRAEGFAERKARYERERAARRVDNKSEAGSE